MNARDAVIHECIDAIMGTDMAGGEVAGQLESAEVLRSLLARPSGAPKTGPDAMLDQTDADNYRVRDEKLLRDTISMLCDVIWNGGKTKPGQHVWTIPADKDRDFDCILSDAIDELVALRALSGAPHGDGQAGTTAEET